MKKWFTNINNLEELKKEYRKLAMKYHPDLNSEGLEIMKEINDEYDEMFKILSSKENRGQGTSEKVNEFKDIINKIIKYNITIDIVGTWVWVYGSGTYEIKEELKELGFRWASKKKKWYWYTGEYKRTARKNYSYEEIKNYHGYETIRKEQKIQMIEG